MSIKSFLQFVQFYSKRFRYSKSFLDGHLREVLSGLFVHRKVEMELNWSK